MKILHVNKFFDYHGGAEVYVRRLMEAQKAQGHEIHIFSTDSPRNFASPDQKYFTERFALDRREGPVRDLHKAANYLWNGAARHSFQKMIAEVKPDVVHLHNIYHHLSTSILGPIRKANIPCVQTLHDYKLACPNYKMFTQGSPCERCRGGHYGNAIKYHCLGAGLAPNVLAMMEMQLAKATQAYEKTARIFFCPSRFMKEKMEDWGEPPSKLRLLPNPVDLSDAPAERGGGYILYVGRLSPEKGLASFLSAARQVPELPVKIAGNGPEEERLKALVKGSSNIEFLGFVAPEELKRVRTRAEAVVLPTLMYENCSGALLEAMADGLPCLATRIGGNPELVEDGTNGLLVKPGDVEDWLKVLRRFMALPVEVRTEMGEKGRAKIRERHVWKTHLAKLDENYQSVGATG